MYLFFDKTYLFLNYYIKNVSFQLRGNQNVIWLGGTNEGSGFVNSFYWNSWEYMMTYTNWNQDEPDNGCNRCVGMTLESGKWSDYSCVSSFGIMCEKIITSE